MRRNAAAIAAVSIWCLLMTSAGLADPTGSQGSFQGVARCTNGQSYAFVVNNANGQGAGSQNQNTAEWAPAHFLARRLSSRRFDLTFTFTPAGGSPVVHQHRLAHERQVGDLHHLRKQTDPAGNTFSLSGTVSGWIS